MKIQNTMISIIIIVKDDRRIEKTLSSLINLPKPEKTEIIVVDASKGKLDNIKNKFPSVIWVYFYNQTNKKITIPEQRNIGLKKTKGEIIVFIDADCIPTHNWLIELVKPIRNDGEYIVSGFIKPTHVSSSLWECNKYKRNEYKEYLSDAPTMNLAFSKKIIRNIGLFDEQFKYSSDTDFCWRAIKSGYKIRYNKKAIIYHNYGSIIKNIKRHFNYGEARFNLYLKYPIKIFKYNSLLSFAYIIFIILLPLSMFWPFYLLLFFIPIIRYVFETNNLRSSLFEVYFNFIEAVGFLKGSCTFIGKRVSNN